MEKRRARSRGSSGSLFGGGFICGQLNLARHRSRRRRVRVVPKLYCLLDTVNELKVMEGQADSSDTN